MTGSGTHVSFGTCPWVRLQQQSGIIHSSPPSPCRHRHYTGIPGYRASGAGASAVPYPPHFQLGTRASPSARCLSSNHAPGNGEVCLAPYRVANFSRGPCALSGRRRPRRPRSCGPERFCAQRHQWLRIEARSRIEARETWDPKRVLKSVRAQGERARRKRRNEEGGRSGVCVCVCVCVGKVELYRLLGLDDESSDPKAPWSGKP